jgi:hypothetical protein
MQPAEECQEAFSALEFMYHGAAWAGSSREGGAPPQGPDERSGEGAVRTAGDQ